MYKRECMLVLQYRKADQGQWILELWYIQPESMGSGTILQTTRVNVFWSYSTYSQLELKFRIAELHNYGVTESESGISILGDSELGARN